MWQSGLTDQEMPYFISFPFDLTLNITDKIKLHSEAAQIYFVGVCVFVRHLYLP
jgi:hypothetical protein